jgi:hypothetical protein
MMVRVVNIMNKSRKSRILVWAYVDLNDGWKIHLMRNWFSLSSFHHHDSHLSLTIVIWSAHNVFKPASLNPVVFKLAWYTQVTIQFSDWRLPPWNPLLSISSSLVPNHGQISYPCSTILDLSTGLSHGNN